MHLFYMIGAYEGSGDKTPKKNSAIESAPLEVSWGICSIFSARKVLTRCMVNPTTMYYCGEKVTVEHPYPSSSQQRKYIAIRYISPSMVSRPGHITISDQHGGCSFLSSFRMGTHRSTWQERELQPITLHISALLLQGWEVLGRTGRVVSCRVGLLVVGINRIAPCWLDWRFRAVGGVLASAW